MRLRVEAGSKHVVERDLDEQGREPDDGRDRIGIAAARRGAAASRGVPARLIFPLRVDPVQELLPPLEPREILEEPLEDDRVRV